MQTLVRVVRDARRGQSVNSFIFTRLVNIDVIGLLTNRPDPLKMHLISQSASLLVNGMAYLENTRICHWARTWLVSSRETFCASCLLGCSGSDRLHSRRLLFYSAIQPVLIGPSGP
jgi:hypothetical protein